MSKWQPFGTAPIDGHEFLAWREDAGAFVVHWRDAADGDEFWCTLLGEDISDDLPSHWMPLPDGPECAHAWDAGSSEGAGPDEHPWTLGQLRGFYDARFYADPADVDTERHVGWLVRHAERLAGEVERKTLALRNVRALAARIAIRGDVRDGELEALLRFCKEGGVEARILRGDDS